MTPTSARVSTCSRSETKLSPYGPTSVPATRNPAGELAQSICTAWFLSRQQFYWRRWVFAERCLLGAAKRPIETGRNIANGVLRAADANTVLALVSHTAPRWLMSHRVRENSVRDPPRLTCRPKTAID